MIYSLNIEDIQEVAQQVLERELTEKEISLVKESVGEHINWFDAIEFAINRHVKIEDNEYFHLE